MRYTSCVECGRAPRFAGVRSRPAIVLARTGAPQLAPDVESGALFEASAIMVSGVGSVVGLTLYALGHTKAAAAFGVASVMVGATVAAARVINQG